MQHGWRAGLSSTALLKIRENHAELIVAGAEYLLSPSTGRAKVERVEVEDHFPTNYSFFQVSTYCIIYK